MRLVDNLKEKRVVTCFLESNGEILILRRSQQVGSYHGRWAGVSGYIEKTADEQALTEIEEETSLCQEELKLIKRGKPLPIKDERLGIKWVVHPYWLVRIRLQRLMIASWKMFQRAEYFC